MRQPFPRTWIVVMDSSRACFWLLTHDANGQRCLEEAAPPLLSHIHAHSGDVLADSGGRYNRGGMGIGQHNMFESHSDPHKQEKHAFVYEVAAYLKHAHDTGTFERLAIVAPVRTIGEFHTSLQHHGLHQAVWREISKDLIKLERDVLWQHIAPELVDHLPA